MDWFFALIYGLSGAFIGSFLNVCILRIPQNRGFIAGRSACPLCGHTLNILDMAPVLSWIFLKGRCRYCCGPISLQYPAVELLTSLVFLLCLAAKGPGSGSAQMCLFGSVLIVAAFIDARYMYIPDGVHLFIIALSLLSLAFGQSPGIVDRIAGAALCGGFLALLYILTRGGVGQGDIKLLTASGLLLGWKAAFASIFLGYIMAGLWYMIPLIRGKVNGKTKAPMAPFFSAALMCFGRWQKELFGWYMNLVN